MDKNWSDRLTDANEATQENLARSEPQIFASYGLVGAILAFGLIGYLVDRATGNRPIFLVTGLIVGIVVGFLNLLRTVRKAGRG